MADVIDKVTDTRPLVGSSAHGNHLALAVASIVVVYGDIGTSPLYEFRVAVVAAAGNGPITQAGLAIRHHVDVLLPVPPCAEAGGSIGHASLAGPPLHRAREVRERCNRL